MSLNCSFCGDQAVSGVNTVELDEYYQVCELDLARLVRDFDMVAVELIPQTEGYWDDCECGCRD